MAVSDSQYQMILQRLTALEETMNNALIAMNRLVALSQVQQVFTVLQTDIANIQVTVDALESRVTALEEEPNT